MATLHSYIHTTILTASYVINVFWFLEKNPIFVGFFRSINWYPNQSHFVCLFICSGHPGSTACNSNLFAECGNMSSICRYRQSSLRTQRRASNQLSNCCFSSRRMANLQFKLMRAGWSIQDKQDLFSSVSKFAHCMSALLILQRNWTC